MNFQGWYTDTVDIWRVVPTTANSLTTNTLTELYTAIPCRIYQSDSAPINMEQTAACHRLSTASSPPADNSTLYSCPPGVRSVQLLCRRFTL